LNYLITHQHKNLTIYVHSIVYSHLTKGLLSIVWKWKRKFKTGLKVKSNSDYYLTEFHFFDVNEEEIKF